MPTKGMKTIKLHLGFLTPDQLRLLAMQCGLMVASLLDMKFYHVFTLMGGKVQLDNFERQVRRLPVQFLT